MKEEEPNRVKEDKKALEEKLKEIQKEKPKAEKLRQVSPEDKSIHVNLTEEEITSVKVLHDRLVRIERILEYLVIAQVTDDQKILPEPNIRDILKEIAAKAKPIRVPPKEEEKDEVPPTA